MASMNATEYRVFARSDFHTFMHRAFRELNPPSVSTPIWNNESVTSKLEACRRGEINRLIINVRNLPSE